MSQTKKRITFILIVLITLAGGYYYYFAHPYDGDKLAEIEQVTTKTWKSYREIISDDNTSRAQKLELLRKLNHESIQLLRYEIAFEKIGDRITPWNKSKFQFVQEYVSTVNGVFAGSITMFAYYVKEQEADVFYWMSVEKLPDRIKKVEQLYMQATRNNSNEMPKSQVPVSTAEPSHSSKSKLTDLDLILGGVSINVNTIKDASRLLGANPSINPFLVEGNPAGMTYETEKVIIQSNSKDNDRIVFIAIKENSIATNRGIKVGDSKEKVEDAYGRPSNIYKRNADTYIYVYNGPQIKYRNDLRFIFDNGTDKVKLISSSALP